MSLPPLHGMSEVDYEAIEAAVTETVRGRWFLNEFARRTRVAETRLLLDAMGRLEATIVGASQPALPSADPSIRLLIQRIKEIAGQLDEAAHAMRDDGVDTRHWTAVDNQARAVAALMRSATPAKPMPRPSAPTQLGAGAYAPRLPNAAPPSPVAAAPTTEVARSEATVVPTQAARLAALSRLDSLTLTEKLALFA